jgi:hypothetical protein
MTHPPFSHACLFTGATNKGGLSGVSVVRTQDSITPFACPCINREGARIGKGGGFSDLEVAFHRISLAGRNRVQDRRPHSS